MRVVAHDDMHLVLGGIQIIEQALGVDRPTGPRYRNQNSHGTMLAQPAVRSTPFPTGSKFSLPSLGDLVQGVVGCGATWRMITEFQL